jgi:integrase
MARTLRDAKLDTRSARSRLAARREPYWRSISDGLAIGYRKGAKGGTWISRHYTPETGRRFSALGAADDVVDADGVHVFAFGQAQEAARAWFASLARQKERGDAPQAGPYTVSMALADYRADYQRRGGKSTDHHDSAAAVWIVPELGAVPLDKLTKRQVTAWHQKVAESPPRARGKRKPGAEPKQHKLDISPEGVRRRRSTANRVLTLLKAALNHAHREGLCASDDAWRTVRGFREVDAARLRYLSDNEARRLTSACPASFRAMVQAALLTGCRYGELTAMTADDFNPDAGTVRIRVSKSGKPRHVVLTQEGRDFFTAAATGKLGSDRLFTRPDGRPWRRSEQARPLAVACEVAKISPAVSFHGLRHTYASRLAMKGVPLQVIAAQLGHADTRMVEKHYGHLAPSYIADTVRAAFGTLGIVQPTNVAPLTKPAA